MIQLRNMAQLGINLFPRTRRSYFRYATRWPAVRPIPGSGCAVRQGFNRPHAVLGTSEGCNVTYSTRTSELWKGAESSFQDEPTSWWKPMFDGDITVCSHGRFKPASHLRAYQNAADGSTLFHVVI